MDKDIININTEIGRLKLQKTEGLQNKIYNLKMKIDRLRLEESTIECIRFIQNPEVSIKPVKPKKTLLIVLAGAGSFLALIFLAFFLEYIQKAKRDNVIK